MKISSKISREKAICFNMKNTWHSISRMYSNLGEGQEISTSSGFILLNIDPKEGTPVTKIGPKIGVEPRSLSRALKALIEKNWIYKEKDPNDGRIMRIKLSKEGVKKREMTKQAVLAFNNALYDRIPKEKLTSFYEVIDHINEYIDEFKATENEQKNN